MNALIAAKGAWVRWTDRSTNRQIFGAAITVGACTAVVKIAAIFKELSIAWVFGIGDDLDILLTALVAPGAAITILAGSLNSAWIPTFVQIEKREGRESARRLFANANVCSLLGLITFALALTLSAPLFFRYLALEFSPEKLARALSLFYLVSPWIVLRGVITLWSAVLNANKRFAAAALSPIITPLCVLAALVFPGGAADPRVVVAAMLFAAVIELAFLRGALRRDDYVISLRWYGLDENTRMVARRWLPMLVGALIMSSSVIIDQAFVAALPSGSVSTFGYGCRLVAFATNLIGIAISAAILPYLSSLVADDAWSPVRNTLRRYLALSFVVSIPITAVFMLFSTEIVEAVLEHGAFQNDSAAEVARVQWMFAMQIPFYVAGLVVVRYIASVGMHHVLMIGAVGNIVLNVALNYAFVERLGIAGIALSTVFVYIFSFTAMGAYATCHLRRRIAASMKSEPSSPASKSIEL